MPLYELGKCPVRARSKAAANVPPGKVRIFERRAVFSIRWLSGLSWGRQDLHLIRNGYALGAPHRPQCVTAAPRGLRWPVARLAESRGQALVVNDAHAWLIRRGVDPKPNTSDSWLPRLIPRLPVACILGAGFSPLLITVNSSKTGAWKRRESNPL